MNHQIVNYLVVLMCYAVSNGVKQKAAVDEPLSGE
jgi:hypothetical protein